MKEPTYYIRDEAMLPPLPQKEIRDLLETFKSTDDEKIKENARVLVVRSNLMFAAKIALEYARLHKLDEQDLYSESKRCLYEAVDKFDLHKVSDKTGQHIQFLSYAAFFIRKALSQVILESRLIHHRRSRGQANSVFGEDSPDNPYCFSFDSVDNFVGDSLTTVGDLLTREDDLNPEDLFTETFEHRDIVLQGLGVLDRRENKIINMLFGLDGRSPTSLREVGEELGISTERVRQVRNKAYRTVRKALESIDPNIRSSL